MKTRIACAAAILLLGPAACGKISEDGVAPPGQEARSTKPRLTSPVPPDDTRQLTRDEAQFALSVLKNAATSDNFFVSPHSLSIALAMTYGGARGQTATQMASALHFTLPDARLHAAFGALDLALAGRADQPVQDGQVFKLTALDQAWGQRGYAFLDSYLDLLAENYGTGLSLLDFAGDADGSRGAINRWVSTRTEGRVPELLEAGVLTPATTLVLSNAVYFKASWGAPFDTNSTTEGSFARLDGSAVEVPLMHGGLEQKYAEGEGWQAVDLPYAGDDVSMLVVLPASGTFEDFRAGLDSARLSSIVGALQPRYVGVTLPRFQIQTKLDAKSTLQDLGMVDAFDEGKADLSGISGSHGLFIQDVVHQAFVSVDESGTEAAASTAVIVARKSSFDATFVATRPFLFVIGDKPTGAVLFVGQVTQP